MNNVLEKTNLFKIGILYVLILVVVELNCKKKSDGTLPPSAVNSIKIVVPSEECKMVIDYSNYNNPNLPIKAVIYPAEAGKAVSWLPSDYLGGNIGTPNTGSCNPTSSSTNSDGEAESFLVPGSYGSTFYGGDDYRVTATSSGYGSVTSPTITLYKKMHIEVDWQTDLAPDLSWITTKFGYVFPGPTANTYILVETHIDETDLQQESFHEDYLKYYARNNHQHKDSFSVYLGTIKYVIDHYTWTGISQRARGDTGWSFICVQAINDLASSYPDSIGWVDTIRKEVTIHEIGHQIFLADHCYTPSCIMDPHVSFGERDTIFCGNHLNDLKSIPKFWR